MSKAFTKEDVDPPERSGRVRSPSGLPPGAVNYITAAGADRLRQDLAQLEQADPRDAAAVADLSETLASITIVPPPEEPDQEVAFGASVKVRDNAGQVRTYRIVGVEEVRFYTDAISWVSPIGRKLLASSLGNRLVLDDAQAVTVIEISYPSE